MFVSVCVKTHPILSDVFLRLCGFRILMVALFHVRAISSSTTNLVSASCLGVIPLAALRIVSRLAGIDFLPLAASFVSSDTTVRYWLRTSGPSASSPDHRGCRPTTYNRKSACVLKYKFPSKKSPVSHHFCVFDCFSHRSSSFLTVPYVSRFESLLCGNQAPARRFSLSLARRSSTNGKRVVVAPVVNCIII